MSSYIDALKNYFNFSGRTSRKDYWFFILFNCIVSAVMSSIDKFSGLQYTLWDYSDWYNDLDVPTEDAAVKIGILTTIYAIAILIPGLSCLVRRLHDVGKSGAFYFILLVPIAGVFILIATLCKAGQPCDNKYGANPNDNVMYNDTWTGTNQ